MGVSGPESSPWRKAPGMLPFSNCMRWLAVGTLQLEEHLSGATVHGGT